MRRTPVIGARTSPSEQCPSHVISTAPLSRSRYTVFDRWMTGVRPVFVSCRAGSVLSAAMCRSSTEYIDSASRTQQVLAYLTLIRRRRRSPRPREMKTDGRTEAPTERTAAAAAAAAARRLIERAFSHICSSSLITLPLRGFCANGAATTVGSWRQTY